MSEQNRCKFIEDIAPINSVYSICSLLSIVEDAKTDMEYSCRRCNEEKNRS